MIPSAVLLNALFDLTCKMTIRNTIHFLSRVNALFVWMQVDGTGYSSFIELCNCTVLI